MTTTTHAPPSPGGQPPVRTGDATGRQAPRLLHRLHFFAGVFCAPLILVAAVTGLLYAVAPTVEQVTNQDMLTVSVPADGADGARLPVSRLVDTAQQHHPDLTLAGVRLGDDDQATRVLFNDPTLPESTLRAVFLDPYTGEVTGDTTQFGESASLPLRQWIDEGHRSLWLGDAGRLYSETAASWLGVLAVGGLALLWTRQRKSTARNRLRGMLRTGGSGRVRTARRHGATGTLIAVGLVFLTVTGLTWSSVAGTNIGQWRTSLHWGTPTVSSALPGYPTTEPSSGGAGAPAGHAGHAGHEGHEAHGDHTMTGGEVRVSGLNAGSIDRVAATAREELRTPVTITPPTAEGQAWTATENRVPYRLSTDSVSVDWATGEVVDRLDFSSWPVAAKATAWMIQLHMGTLFGLPNQIVLALLATAIIAMVCWGYAMWWMRRPTGRLAGPPRRTGWARPQLGTVLLVVALIAYGVIAPLFGVTCLAFLVGSALWSLMRRRRAGHPVDSASTRSHGVGRTPKRVSRMPGAMVARASHR